VLPSRWQPPGDRKVTSAARPRASHQQRPTGGLFPAAAAGLQVPPWTQRGPIAHGSRPGQGKNTKNTGSPFESTLAYWPCGIAVHPHPGGIFAKKGGPRMDRGSSVAEQQGLLKWASHLPFRPRTPGADIFFAGTRVETHLPAKARRGKTPPPVGPTNQTKGDGFRPR